MCTDGGYNVLWSVSTCAPTVAITSCGQCPHVHPQWLCTCPIDTALLVLRAVGYRLVPVQRLLGFFLNGPGFEFLPCRRNSLEAPEKSGKRCQIVAPGWRWTSTFPINPSSRKCCMNSVLNDHTKLISEMRGPWRPSVKQFEWQNLKVQKLMCCLLCMSRQSHHFVFGHVVLAIGHKQLRVWLRSCENYYQGHIQSRESATVRQRTNHCPALHLIL